MPPVIETLTPTKISIILEIDPKKVKETEQKVFVAFAKEIEIKGFRKGKAPRPLVEQRINQDTFRREVVNRCLPEAYEQVLKSEKIKPVSSPRFELISYEDGQPMKVKATLEKRPEIALSEQDYKGVECTVKKRKFQEEDVEKTVVSIQEQRTTYEDLPEAVVEEGRGVLLDFQGFVDGKPFEGGTMQQVLLDVRKNWPVLPGFMEQILGMKAGESREFPVKLPEVSDAPLSAKEAIFRVHVHAVKEKKIPPADDALAQSAGKFQNLAELRDAIRKNLLAFLQNQEKNEGLEKVVEALAARLDFPVPEILIQEEKALLEREIMHRLENERIPFVEYLRSRYPEVFSIELPREEEKLERATRRFHDDLGPPAKKNAKRKLVLEEIAEREKLSITQEELNQEIRRISGIYGMTPEAIAKKLHDPEIFQNFITGMLCAKASLFLRENLKITHEEELGTVPNSGTVPDKS